MVKLYAETARARIAVDHAKSSVRNFSYAFRTVRQNRNASGAPTDGEQDLFRAAVAFAAAGLDISVKSLIRDSLKTLAEKDDKVAKGFEEYTRRKLKSDSGILGESEPSRFLAKILVSSSPYERLIEHYIYDLTGSSLQSLDELHKAASALDIDKALLKEKASFLRESFIVRNDIIHELDVNFDTSRGKRSRKSRTKKHLNNCCEVFLLIAEYFIDQVELKIAG